MVLFQSGLPFEPTRLVDLINEEGEALASLPNAAGVLVLAQEPGKPSPALSFVQLGDGELSGTAWLAGRGGERGAAQPAALAWGLTHVRGGTRVQPAPPSLLIPPRKALLGSCWLKEWD